MHFEEDFPEWWPGYSAALKLATLSDYFYRVYKPIKKFKNRKVKRKMTKASSHNVIPMLKPEEQKDELTNLLEKMEQETLNPNAKVKERLLDFRKTMWTQLSTRRPLHR